MPIARDSERSSPAGAGIDARGPSYHLCSSAPLYWTHNCRPKTAAARETSTKKITV